MPTFPIPMFAALVLGVLLVALLRREGRVGALPVLLGLCAVQGLIISLVQHYGVAAFRNVQPITASLIPALAWISFQGTAIRGMRWRYDIWHGLGPLFCLFCLMVAPAWLDVAIPVLYLGYGGAMLWTMMQGADALPRLRLGAGDVPLQVWRVIGLCLIASAVSDVAIVAAQMTGRQAWQPWIISLFSTGTLIVVGALTLSESLAGGDGGLAEGEGGPQASTPMDDELMVRLDQLMDAQRLYLNPDLTLTQLARRLHVPVKHLSAAINRKTGANVSRYINARRILVACDALRAGESVTSAMLSSGFNTKSNFNRAFLDSTGVAPRDWVRDWVRDGS